jgi:hypothetical protein
VKLLVTENYNAHMVYVEKNDISRMTWKCLNFFSKKQIHTVVELSCSTQLDFPTLVCEVS